MKLLGIDYGRSKVGLALAEEDLPTPLSVVKVSSLKDAVAKVSQIAQRQVVDRCIVGLPGGMLDPEIKEFGKIITNQTGIPVFFIDETLSSYQSTQLMIEGNKKRKLRQQTEDAVAASLILQTYLESKPKEGVI